MRNYLLSEKGRCFKANLHCHSTVSDGNLTPAELKRLYKSRGYSVLAFTDHDVMIPHTELSDADFLALAGYELEFKESVSSGAPRHCHLCFIAPSADAKMAAAHRTKYLYGNSSKWINKAPINPADADFEREYSSECVNRAVRLGRERGYFVTYNHPAWSFEGADKISSYEGLSAIEILNTNSQKQGFPEDNPALYDELLRRGKHLLAIGADDNHNEFPTTSKSCDSFGAYTVIKAERLSYTEVMNALLKGSFYSSEAPEIRALWYEDGKLHIRTSPAEAICFSTATRHTKNCTRVCFEPLTEAYFEPRHDDLYVRVTVTDAKGKKAYTNAYFIDEII